MTTDIFDLIDNASPLTRVKFDQGIDTMVIPQNCHGCKWFDEIYTLDGDKKYRLQGDGYCAMVERSRSYHRGDKIRTEHDERCELYATGDFKIRFYQADGEGCNDRV